METGFISAVDPSRDFLIKSGGGRIKGREGTVIKPWGLSHSYLRYYSQGCQTSLQSRHHFSDFPTAQSLAGVYQSIHQLRCRKPPWPGLPPAVLTEPGCLLSYACDSPNAMWPRYFLVHVLPDRATSLRHCQHQWTRAFNSLEIAANRTEMYKWKKVSSIAYVEKWTLPLCRKWMWRFT